MIAVVYVALSRGWSLTGNHVAATCGCPATTAPSGVWNQPAWPRAGSSSRTGTPWYFIVTRNFCPFFRAFFGVTTSSCPVRVHEAATPLTRSASIFRPTKSRLNLESDVVAVARTPVTARIACVVGL